MTSKRKLRRRCEEKRSYATWQEAAAMAAALRRKYDDSGIVWYRCHMKRVKHYHVGHRPGAMRQRIGLKKRFDPWRF